MTRIDRIRSRTTAAVVVALVVSFAAACTPSASDPGPRQAAAEATAPTAWQSEMLARIDAERAAVGAGPLVLCGTLMAAAQAHAEDQANHATMSHTGSDGSSMVDRAVAAGYTGWTALGENVAYGYPTVDAVMAAWLASPGHRANLLNPAFVHVGLGQAADTAERLAWTQDFGASGRC
jgi:uncharacterized protein YkwD